MEVWPEKLTIGRGEYTMWYAYPVNGQTVSASTQGDLAKEVQKCLRQRQQCKSSTTLRRAEGLS
jgi:uncharacterized protein